MIEKEEFNCEERKELMENLEKIENDGITDDEKRSTQNKSGCTPTDKQNDMTKTKNYLYKTEENKKIKNEVKEKKLNKTEKKSEINENNKNDTHYPEIIIEPIPVKVSTDKNIQENEESNSDEKKLDFQNENKINNPEDLKENCNIKESSLTIQNGDHINNPQINVKEKSMSNPGDNQNINNIQNFEVNEDVKSMSISNEIQNNESNLENNEGNSNGSSEKGDPMSLSGEIHYSGEDMLNNRDNNEMQSIYIDNNDEFDITNENTNVNNNENTENYLMYGRISNLSDISGLFSRIDDPQSSISGYKIVKSNKRDN